MIKAIVTGLLLLVGAISHAQVRNEYFSCESVTTAIDNGDASEVARLINLQSADVNCISSMWNSDYSNVSPLVYAALKEKEDIAQLLLESGANVNLAVSQNSYDNNNEITPLTAAAKKNLNITLMFLSHQADPNYQMKDSTHDFVTATTPIMYAKDAPTVNALVAFGGHVDTMIDQCTAMNFNQNPDAINELVRLGADINHVDSRGQTGFISAVLDNKSDTVRAFAKNGANVNSIYATTKEPALVLATRLKYEESIQALVELKADLNSKNSDGESSLIIASKEWKNVDILNMLIKAGASPDTQDNKGKTALMMAAFADDTTTAQLLIDAKANVKLRDKAGKSAYDYASANDMRALIKAAGGH